VKIELNRDWSEFLSALISRRVRFLLIGGHAVAGHGEPRLTEDLDVFVAPTLANARRLRDALCDFGFAAAAPSAEDLACPDKVFMLGRKVTATSAMVASCSRVMALRMRSVEVGRLSIPFQNRWAARTTSTTCIRRISPAIGVRVKGQPGAHARSKV
jgi:hypothetical protein